MSRPPNSSGKSVVVGFGNARGGLVMASDIKLGRAARRASERQERRARLTTPPTPPNGRARR